MKVRYRLTAIFLFMLCFCFVLTACNQKDSKITVFESEFKDGNNDVFGGYGTVVSNDDFTISLIKSENSLVGPLSYFGQNEKKNSVWTNSGLEAEIELKLNPTDFEVNDYFNISFYINNKQNEILTSVSFCFRKFQNALRVGTSKKSGEENNLLATDFNNEEAKTITENKRYKLICSFYSSIDSKLLCTLKIEDDNKKEIFSSSPKYLLLENNEEVNISSVGGIRCVWLDLMNTQFLVVDKIHLYEN